MESADESWISSSVVIWLSSNRSVLACRFVRAAPASAQEASAPKEVTFNQDVAPILFKNCVVCHRPNDIAPMSLMTYKDTPSCGRGRFATRW